MAIDPNLLLRYASLKKTDHDTLMDLDHRYPGIVTVDRAKLAEILAGVADDRLAFADRRAHLAAGVLETRPGDDDVAQRDALTAAYDAAHHALRALHIGFAGWDPIGHQETIDATNELFGDNGDLAKRFDWMRLGRPLPDVVNDLRTERQAAEWDVYNRDEEAKPRVDFAAQAPIAVKLAQDAARTIRAALYDHRAATL